MLHSASKMAYANCRCSIQLQRCQMQYTHKPSEILTSLLQNHTSFLQFSQALYKITQSIYNSHKASTTHIIHLQFSQGFYKTVRTIFGLHMPSSKLHTAQIPCWHGICDAQAINFTHNLHKVIEHFKYNF